MNVATKLKQDLESYNYALGAFKGVVKELQDLHPKKTFSYDDIYWMLDAAIKVRAERFNVVIQGLNKASDN